MSTINPIKELLNQSIKSIEMDNGYFEAYISTTPLKLEICRNMTTYGGSFVKCLSACIITADRINLYKLVVAFRSYFNEYLPHMWESDIKI